jgi:hypothetical protein
MRYRHPCRARQLLAPTIAILAILAALDACDDAAGAVAPPDVRTEEGGLVTTFRVTPARVAPGGSFAVRVALVNPTRDTLRIQFGCTQPIAQMTARQPGGETVLLEGLPAGCFTAVSWLTLAPGAERVIEGTGRAAKFDASARWVPLARGRYELEVWPAVLEVNGTPVEGILLRRPLVVD